MTELWLAIHTIVSFIIVLCFLVKHRHDFLDDEDFGMVSIFLFVFCVIAGPVLVIVYAMSYLGEAFVFVSKTVPPLFDAVENWFKGKDEN